MTRSDHLRLRGLHAHIGSQIFELEPYKAAIAALAEFASGLEVELLNVGGGLASHTPPTTSRPRSTPTRRSRSAASPRSFDPVPKILVEPGRSLVGNAGVTMYTVGTIKEIPGVRTWVAVDGGMSDNMRPMLYGVRLRGTARQSRRRGAPTGR